MMLQIPQVLTKAQVAQARALIDAGEWVDGNVTSGFQSALAKNNLQLPEGSAASLQAGALVREALTRNALFTTAALPASVFPPMFNRYGPGKTFADHFDNAIRQDRDGVRLRADISATLFLSEPDQYEGGELTVEDTYGVHQVKLEAGDLILYPASSLHRVEPVTAGERTAAVLWVQSLVREDARRALLFDMDMAVQSAGARLGQGDTAVIALTGAYHNLLRMWAEL
ncbi:MAG: Fe2+-dependent dioxygenase [Phenylobacterium sp.]|uniref:Fe2+-dependent dioxygenase n=1 Tax=Phenylobacterium sp. TaxID=1871053 RepID=UPI0027343DB9|nr:Fe2+-dependent dioxygenase [Phenylobacterium sp.]MDP3175363.1 Fe2+-dependent dioxygenase [Phenylobacterium sp.]